MSKTVFVRLTGIADGSSNTIHIVASAGRPDLHRVGNQLVTPAILPNGI